MARQAASFALVDNPITQGSVRPVFPLLGEQSDIPAHKAATGEVVSASPSLLVRPPRGQLWELVYACSRLSAYSSPTTGKSVYCNIKMVVDGTEVLLRTFKITQGDGQTWDDVITELSLGAESPLSFDRYLKIDGTHDGNVNGTATWNGLALVRQL